MTNRRKHKQFAIGMMAFGAMAGLAPTIAPVAAQTVLSDYENSDAAQRARENAIWRLAFRPPMQVLQQTVSALRRNVSATPAQLETVDRLVTEARSQPEDQARRSLWHASSLLLGKSWTPGEELIGSLALKVPTTVVTGRLADVTLQPAYAAPAVPGAKFTIDLVRAKPTSSATPQRGEMVRQLAAGAVSGSARPVKLDLSGVEDGFYIAVVKVATPDGASGELAGSFHVVQGLAKRRAALEKQMAGVVGHDAARQTALYPFELANALNAGTREVISYDFKAALARSEAIASALAKGQDTVARATGLQNRAYRFAETGELVPYQIYVPSKWSPDRKWPLVVALHGANLDETNMLGRADGQMQKLAEDRGFIVVAPLGYRINSIYGSQRGIGESLGVKGDRVRRSEDDVIAVTDLVAAEYNADPARTYLTGNSMGGSGTWWIGAKYHDRWAAIAPAAFGGVIAADVAPLSQVPVLAVVGEKDELGMRDRVKESVAVLRAGGLRPGYLEIPGGTHSSGFDIALSRIFDFFEQHTK